MSWPEHNIKKQTLYYINIIAPKMLLECTSMNREDSYLT